MVNLAIVLAAAGGFETLQRNKGTPWNPKQPFYNWLFQLDDSKLYKKWLELTISIHFKLVGFGVPAQCSPCLLVEIFDYRRF